MGSKDELHIRNAKALDNRNKAQQSEIDALRKRLETLEQIVPTLQQQVNALNGLVATALSAKLGGGPTA